MARGPETREPQPGEKSYPPKPPNLIFVGTKKPAISYATFAYFQLMKLDEIVLRARGGAISRAVDAALIVTSRLGKGAFKVKRIHIDTEVIGEGAEARNVSTIEIVVGK